MISLTEYFKCGYVTKNKKAFYFIVSKFDDITNKIIPPPPPACNENS